jgi:hypothetical protein
LSQLTGNRFGQLLAPTRRTIGGAHVTGPHPPGGHPPAMSWVGCVNSGRQTKNPPTGPRMPMRSPCSNSSTRDGDTSPPGSRATAISTNSPDATLTTEKDRTA